MVLGDFRHLCGVGAVPEPSPPSPRSVEHKPEPTTDGEPEPAATDEPSPESAVRCWGSPRSQSPWCQTRCESRLQSSPQGRASWREAPPTAPWLRLGPPDPQCRPGSSALRLGLLHHLLRRRRSAPWSHQPFLHHGSSLRRLHHGLPSWLWPGSRLAPPAPSPSSLRPGSSLRPIRPGSYCLLPGSSLRHHLGFCWSSSSRSSGHLLNLLQSPFSIPHPVPILGFWGPYAKLCCRRGGVGVEEWMKRICPCFTPSRIALAEGARETVSLRGMLSTRFFYLFF